MISTHALAFWLKLLLLKQFQNFIFLKGKYGPINSSKIYYTKSQFRYQNFLGIRKVKFYIIQLILGF